MLSSLLQSHCPASYSAEPPLSVKISFNTSLYNIVVDEHTIVLSAIGYLIMNKGSSKCDNTYYQQAVVNHACPFVLFTNPRDKSVLQYNIKNFRSQIL